VLAGDGGHELQDELGRLGLASARLAGDDAALVALVAAHVVVRVVRDREDVRRHVADLLALVALDNLGGVDRKAQVRVGGDQDGAGERVDGAHFLAGVSQPEVVEDGALVQVAEIDHVVGSFNRGFVHVLDLVVLISRHPNVLQWGRPGRQGEGQAHTPNVTTVSTSNCSIQSQTLLGPSEIDGVSPARPHGQASVSMPAACHSR